MIVLALAVVIIATFVTLGLVSSHQPPAPRTAPPSPVSGSSLQAQPATTLLAPIVTGGDPPTNVVDAVVVPAGAVRLRSQNDTAGAGRYDAHIVLRTGSSQAALLAFFDAEMPHLGWQVFDRGGALHDPGAQEVLGRLAGSDGNYWEMGAVVDATTFPRGGPPRGVTDVTVRLFQQSDDS
jgi:hypothetical protein